MSDDTKTETKKRSGRPPGGRNKVVKSPTKTDPAVIYCPCSDYMEGELSVECETCKKYWHLCCVGLRGLTGDMIDSLDHWDCPDCYRCPHSYKEKTLPTPTGAISGSQADCGIFRVMLKDELHSIQPVIRVTVENAVRKLLPNTICSKEDVESAIKSYADVTRESQKKVIEEATLTQSSKNVVESVVRKLDADKVEREKRVLNVVVLNAPESPKEASSEQKKKEDTDFCINVLGMDNEDFQSCWRAGKVDESKPNYCQPLVVQMVDEGTVDEWTNNGKGFKTDSGYWINNDLCSADRRANFIARQERRKRIKSKNE